MSKDQIDLLAIVAHPDDAEISAGGTLLSYRAKGFTTGIVDLTLGELGTRGTAHTRATESEQASRMLGLSARENLQLPDGFFDQGEESMRRVISAIRKYRPKVVLTNAPEDRHPDHGRASKLVRDACFYSGLVKIDTGQELWRPSAVYYMIQDRFLQPSFVVDVTTHWSKKIDVLRSYSTQFFKPESAEPQTPISGKEFFDFLHGRAINLGRPAGYLLAEGFIADRTPGVRNLIELD
jgi:N-acetylglucosamine malate deacetylase 1